MVIFLLKEDNLSFLNLDIQISILITIFHLLIDFSMEMKYIKKFIAYIKGLIIKILIQVELILVRIC